MSETKSRLPEPPVAAPPVGWNGVLRIGRKEIPVSYDAASRWAVRLWRAAVLVGIVVAIWQLVALSDHVVSLTGTISTKEASRGTGDQRTDRAPDGPAGGDDR